MVNVRPARVDDAAAVWRLVRETGVLDVNSPYAYLMAFRHFAGTCLVAERGTSPDGFVLAFCPPARPDTVFVWQIGVAKNAQGRGVGGKLLDTLTDRFAKQSGRYLEATVTPSNEASQKLFSRPGPAIGHAVPREPLLRRVGISRRRP
ncbi:MAG: diaminobutyrate acetyltransferase [Deltaproteobacteria bacterium]|nr:diaminobutyrate acetyltransferase [Deltaproteobacteria bacterium]